MPETGQPGGGSRSRSVGTQGGQMAAGMKGPFIRVLHTNATAGNVEVNVACPIGVRWNVVSVSAYVDTTSDAGNRYVTVDVEEVKGGDFLHRIFGSGAIAADFADWVMAGPSEDATPMLSYPYPLVDGMNLECALTDGVAGDSWRLCIVVMEWKI